MIISHKHKFIFIRTRKIASTSLEIGLSRFCGKKDIITPIGKIDEETRKVNGGMGPQNFKIDFRYYRKKDWYRLFKKHMRARFHPHASAAEIRARVDNKIWESYYKFCFERNPWDRAVSFYFWETRNCKPKPSFSDFISSALKEKLSIYWLYTINDKIAVDHIARFENLANELEWLESKLDFPDKITLPRSKSDYRKDRRPYQEFYSDTEIDIIRRICAKEISLLGYTFL